MVPPTAPPPLMLLDPAETTDADMAKYMKIEWFKMQQRHFGLVEEWKAKTNKELVEYIFKDEKEKLSNR